jgi:hypothetical protein
VTEQAIPRPWKRPKLRILIGKTGWQGYFPKGSSAEDLGPHDCLSDAWVPDKQGNETLMMSEPDLGHEKEDTPERLAAHAVWLEEYCKKHRSKDA